MLFLSRWLVPGKLRDLKTPVDYLVRAGQTGLTFLGVSAAFVFFALPIDESFDFLQRMLQFNGGGLSGLGYTLLYATVAWLLFDLTELYSGDKLTVWRIPSPIRGMALGVMVILSVVIGMSYVQEFIYQQF
jgi:hypothetical protein